MFLTAGKFSAVFAQCLPAITDQLLAPRPLVRAFQHLRWIAEEASTSHSKPASSAGLFDKILVSNRGEIACRIFRTSKRLGIKTVAIYSEADQRSMHVAQADEAICVGPAAALKSYLNIDAIMRAIEVTGAQAVHPGYGFLSENAAFVRALEDRGVAFIGPPPSAIASLGDKVESKRIAHQAGISTIPGWVGEVRDIEHAAKVAREIGYPVMVKASAGGGGKGMRFVWTEAELREQLPEARAEAVGAFGNGALLIEKFVEGARHVEVQVVGDKMGNILYLPERDCSVQRRNQKVIEESPSPFITPTMRAAMGEQAVALARAVGYYSTGTVEFVVDKYHNFYFLEMNTRLQVEHPVTEAVTGLDLVELMIRVAAGQPLELTQQQAAAPKGWAVEARVYAEDPARNFLPSPGILKHLVEPSGPGVRIDTGVCEGSIISMYYDPMISKLIAHGATRPQALQKLARALDRYIVRGVAQNIPFLRSILNVEAFQEGAYDTTFIPAHYASKGALHPLNFHLSKTRRLELMSAAAALRVSAQLALQPALLDDGGEVALVLTLSQPQGQEEAEWGQVAVTVRRAAASMVGVGGKAAGAVEVEIAGRAVMQVHHKPLPHPHYPPNPRGSQQHRDGVSAYTPFLHLLEIDGVEHYFQVAESSFRAVVLQYCGAQRHVTIDTPRSAELAVFMPKQSQQDVAKTLRSPMTGTVVSVLVKEGDVVEGGQEAFVVEAMKMRNVVRVDGEGTVREVRAIEGQVVSADEVLLWLE